MIRAADFYRFVLEKIAANRNFTFLQSEIVSAENGTVNTAAGEFEARELVFESFTRKSYDDPRYRNLFQHFRGWVIETGGAAFDPNEPTLFDFRVAQMNECRFVYILPFSASRALVEFTIFSDNLPDKSVYEENLRSYIENVLGQKNYEILETETGLIPMSDEPHVEFPDAKTIRIGTAGGYVKPSTGYSFTRTQNRLQKLVGKLENPQNQRPKTKDRRPNVWKSYLDSVLLDVLLTKKHAADEVFTALFSKNPAALVLKFLDEETSPAEDLRIMKSVPLPAFSRAALETALKNLRRK
jgi:lycopene beta-cyclase